MSLTLIVMSGLLMGAQPARPPRRLTAPPPPPRTASQPNPVNTIDDLNAAVVPPAPGSLEDTPASLRDHEQRTAQALDPNNPSNVGASGPTGAGCGPGGGSLLSCGTNREVSSRPDNAPASDPRPATDLVGRPR